MIPTGPESKDLAGGHVTDENGASPSTGAVEPFFAPSREDQAGRVSNRRFRVRRLAVRVVVCVLALVALDRVIAPSFAPPAAYLEDYRLPRTAPTAALADYVGAIDLAARVPDHPPIAVFLGASPTFGHRIQDARNTFPYAYASAAASVGVPVTAFNLATNGEFVGDYYVLAKRLAPDADIVFVQLTYHTFSPTARGGLHVRYPELPQVLGVSLTAEEAGLLGLPGSDVSPSAPAASAAVGGFLSRWWTLWRERDLIDRRLFGGSPRDALAAFVARATGTATTSVAATVTTLPDDAANDGFASFDDLDPGQQMVVLSRYAQDSSFTIDPADGEVVLLDRLAAELAAAHKKAVFFMGPLNEKVISFYGLIDPAQYKRNMDLLRATVESHGFTLIDHNADASALPRADFADISHTTDAGGAAFGALLFRDTSAYLRAVAP
jgi:hypothetical protein